DLGGDWVLEQSYGEIGADTVYSAGYFHDWKGTLTLNVTTGTTAAQTTDAITMGNTSGLTATGATLNNTSVAWYGTFTTTGSLLGLPDGAVLSTGLVATLPGNPATAPNASGASTGVTSGSERDIGTLSFNFQTETGVTKIVAVYVMGSEEYPEYTNQGFSDNVTITLNGGAYTNTNIALVPGTSSGVDIDTINATTNSSFYRGATKAAPTAYALTDIVLDGFTTVLSNVRTVAVGTNYSVTIKVADFTDNQYDSAVFVHYFGSSLRLDLDGNNSTAGNANFATTYTENSAGISILDSDATLTNYDTTDPVSATIRLNNAQAGDSLTVGTLPSGITSSINTSVPGVITVTLSGASSEANYLTALNAIKFSNSSESPSTVARDISIVLNDGATNSNTARTTITVVSVNDAPVNTLPASYTTNEDVSVQLTGLSIADVDAASGTMTVTLGVNAGTLAATSGGGVTVGGSGTGTLTLSGTLANINTFLGGVSAPNFTPAGNANGSVTLTMTTSDGGNTGTGGTLTDVDTRTITVNAVNDAPVNTLPASFATNEDTSLSLAGLGITDVDAAAAAVTVTLSVSSGTLTAATSGGVTVSGSGTAALTLSGTVANINAWLAAAGSRPTFVPAANTNGA
ncbi:MAG: choice-of-anchor L domain-containing protein, partial [Beijerinckiaceae bacterium]